MNTFKEKYVPRLMLTALILVSIVGGWFVTYKYIEHTFNGAEYIVDEAKNVVYIIAK